MRALTAVLATLVPVALLTGCASGGPAGPPTTVPTTAVPAQAGSAPEWQAYHGNGRRTGFAAAMQVPLRLHVTKNIRLDGAVYASPIVVHGVTIVATENDTVYAFGQRFQLLWKRHLGRPAPSSELPCGNIDPLGITGTPVFAAATGLVYVAAEFAGNPPTHQLVALHASSGKLAWRRGLDLRGVDRAAMQQRGALTLAGKRVWVPFGGLAGDCGQYKGRVVGYPWAGRGAPRAFTVPTAREGGIWTPPGPTADGHGHLYVSVGNGASGPGDRYDHSDSVLELSTAARIVGSFSPRSWATDNAADLDLGSQGPALVGQWVFIAGKSGSAYVLRQSRLGGIGGQVSSMQLCTSFGGTAVVGSTVYVPCTDGVRAVRIDTRGRMHVVWKTSSSIAGSPVVGGGRVWSLDPSAGVLHELNQRTGQPMAAVRVGATTRFATPAIAGSNLLVPTESGLVVVATR